MLAWGVFPLRSSSLILSLIRTLASIAMPRVKAIAASPGRVKVASIIVKIPINKVVAKPFIGPVPKENNINAVKPVVIFASNIEDKAFAKPSSIAATCFLPFIISSLTLS